MRFCDFFLSYKIALRDLRQMIPLTKLPLYRKVFLVIFTACGIVSGILFVIGLCLAATFILSVGILLLLGFAFMDTRKKNLQKMLDEHYRPYSGERMKKTEEVLKLYGLDSGDAETIDRLIEEAKYAQEKCDYAEALRKPFKTLGAMIIPIVVYVANEISEAASYDEKILMAVQAIVVIILAFSLVTLLAPTVKDFLRSEYNRYEEFIYDMRQLKLFHSAKA